MCVQAAFGSGPRCRRIMVGLTGFGLETFCSRSKGSAIRDTDRGSCKLLQDLELVRLAGFEPATSCSGVVSKAANSFILRHSWQPKGRFRNVQDTQWVPNGYRSSTPCETSRRHRQAPNKQKSNDTACLVKSNGACRTPDYSRAGVAAKWLTGTLLGETGILPDASPTMMKPAQ